LINKILDQLRKFAWLIIGILILIILLSFIQNLRQSAAYKVEKQNFEEKLKQSESDIKNLNEAQLNWMNAAMIEKANAEKQAKVNKELEEQLKKIKIENEQQKGLIEKMTADEVLIETRAKLSLSETDIWKNRFGVQFSLMGAKKNLLRLSDADYFTLVKEPILLKIIEGKDKQINSLNTAIINDENALKTCDEIKQKYSQIQISYADILKKSERQAKWLKFSIGGFAVAVTAGGLYLLFGNKK
jgi:hypothetical protein